MRSIFIMVVALLALLAIFVPHSQAQPVVVDELAMDSLDTASAIEGGDRFVLSTEPRGDGKICPHLGLLSGTLFDLRTQNTLDGNDKTSTGIRRLWRQSIFAVNVGLDSDVYNVLNSLTPISFY